MRVTHSGGVGPSPSLSLPPCRPPFFQTLCNYMRILVTRWTAVAATSLFSLPRKQAGKQVALSLHGRITRLGRPPFVLLRRNRGAKEGGKRVDRNRSICTANFTANCDCESSSNEEESQTARPHSRSSSFISQEEKTTKRGEREARRMRKRTLSAKLSRRTCASCSVTAAKRTRRGIAVNPILCVRRASARPPVPLRSR